MIESGLFSLLGLILMIWYMLKIRFSLKAKVMQRVDLLNSDMLTLKRKAPLHLFKKTNRYSFLKKWEYPIEVLGGFSQLKKGMVLACLISASQCVLTYYLIIELIPNNLSNTVTVVLLSLIFLLCTPLFFLAQITWKYSHYLKNFEAHLPLALEQMARATSSGVSVLQALKSISHQAHPVIRQEFLWLLHRMSIGEPIDQVLKLSSKRVQLLSYRFFCLVLLLNFESGGRLSQVLFSQSEQLKRQQRSKQKLLTLTSEPRMAAKMVAAIPVFVLAVMHWLNPEHVGFLIRDEQGKAILVYAVGSIAFGLFTIRWLLSGANR